MVVVVVMVVEVRDEGTIRNGMIRDGVRDGKEGTDGKAREEKKKKKSGEWAAWHGTWHVLFGGKKC